MVLTLHTHTHTHTHTNTHTHIYIYTHTYTECFKGMVHLKFVVVVFLFLIGIHSIQVGTATMRHGVTRKEAKKRLQDTENLFRKNLQLKDFR